MNVKLQVLYQLSHKGNFNLFHHLKNHCGIDLVCNISRTSQGFLHRVVIVCYLNKFVVARPLSTKTSKEIVGYLQEIYLTFGVQKIIQHDQGQEFSSMVNQ